MSLDTHGHATIYIFLVGCSPLPDVRLEWLALHLVFGCLVVMHALVS